MRGELKLRRLFRKGSLLVGCAGVGAGTALAAANDDLPRRSHAPTESYAQAVVIYDSVRDSRGDRARVHCGWVKTWFEHMLEIEHRRMVFPAKHRARSTT